MAICPVMYQSINALEWGDTQDIREQVTRRCEGGRQWVAGLGKVVRGDK